METPIITSVITQPSTEPTVSVDSEGDVHINLGSVVIFLRPDVAEDLVKRILAVLSERTTEVA